jgi:hypothetical protein
METIARWEARYGSGWIDSLEKPDILGDTEINDQQKIRMIYG